MNRPRPGILTAPLSVSGLALAVFCAMGLPARAYTLLSSNQLVFVNVDHAPVGAYSTFAYGAKGDKCGFGFSSSSIPYSGGGGGVVIALAGSNGLQALPFVASPASISSSATFFADTNVQRTLTPCTDEWNVGGGALTWTHYTPAWKMPSFDSATLADKKRFFLPATWMIFTIQNTNTTPEDFYFGLPVAATPKSFAGGAYQGFVIGEGALAAQAGACDVLSGAALTAALNGMSAGCAFHLNIPAGQTKSLTVVAAFYRSAVTDSRIGAHYYYTSLFDSMDSVIDAAFAGFADAQMRCQQLASAMAGANLNVYREFLASDALHSYMACTVADLDSTNGFGWREMEGEYNYINTFDLTVDHSFYDSLMYPWALRNVLDTYSGTFNGAGFTFTHPLYDIVANAVVSPNGFGFHHDMGTGLTSDSPATDPTSYESGFSYMGQEELDNWILSAGIYWSRTGDSAWLTNNTALLQTCLNSMLLRDDTNAATRDGVTTYLNERGSTPEITTYDGLDSSLKNPRLNAFITVKNWASYLALEAMFNQIGDEPDALAASNSAGLAAQSIVNAWNTYHATLGYIPAFLDGSNQSALLPIIEGLAYPAQMGLTNAVDPNGPYGAMLQALSNHVVAVLSPGRCLDSTSGAWKLSSANVNTWQSKVYLGQYIAEHILGINNSNVDGVIDQIHATIEAQEAVYQGWSDQLNSTGSGNPLGSQHYPRGVTSALWWLNATNNPGYLLPSQPPEAPTGLFATANNGQVTLTWNGAALATDGYNVHRSGQSGGPFSPVTNGVAGASFTDTGLTNGVTYYYVVTATNQVGESPPSAEVSATPYLPPPGGLSASAGNGVVILNWSASIGVSGYNVFRSTVSGGSYAAISTNVAATTFSDTNVVNGVTYYYALTATAPGGGQTGLSAEVSATPLFSIPLYAVNCGGGAAGSFAADAFYAGGSTYSTTSAINTNAAPFPAPMAVYQTERYAASSGNVTYTFTNLVPGNDYLVRLHFAEIYFTAPGQRVFNVLINGDQVLTNFDIYAAAGSSNTAVVREFTLPADGSGRFVIVATNVVQNAKISGIQILSVGAFLPSVGTNITAAVAGANLTLSWPSNYVGWILQTNAIDLGTGADWGDVPNSQTNQQMTFPITDPALLREFFRLRHP